MLQIRSKVAGFRLSKLSFESQFVDSGVMDLSAEKRAIKIEAQVSDDPGEIMTVDCTIEVLLPSKDGDVEGSGIGFAFLMSSQIVLEVPEWESVDAKELKRFCASTALRTIHPYSRNLLQQLSTLAISDESHLPFELPDLDDSMVEQ